MSRSGFALAFTLVLAACQPEAGGPVVSRSGDDETRLAAATHLVWSAETVNRLGVAGAPGIDGITSSMSASPDGRWLAAISMGGGPLQLYDLRGRRAVAQFGGPYPQQPQQAVFTRDGRMIMAEALFAREGGAFRRIKDRMRVSEIDLAGLRVTRSIEIDADTEYMRLALPKDRPVVVAMRPNSQRAVIDALTGTTISTLSNVNDMDRGSPGGSRVVVRRLDESRGLGNWRLYWETVDLATGAVLPGFNIGKDYYEQNMGNQTLALGGLRAVAWRYDSDSSPAVWDVETARPLWGYPQATGLNKVALSPDGGLLVGMETKGQIKVWDTTSGRLRQTLPVSGEYANVLTLPDNARAVISNSGAPLQLWHLPTGRMEGTFTGNPAMAWHDKHGLDYVAQHAGNALKAALDTFAGKPPEPPAKLAQDKYESRAAFDERVATAGQRHDAAVRSWQDKAAGFPRGRRLAAMEEALHQVLGPPVVERSVYDPESQTFTIEVVSGFDRDKGFRRTFLVQQKVPNSEAAAVDRALQTSQPEIRFKLDGDRFTLDDMRIRLPGRDLAALPAEGSAGAVQLAEVDLTGLFPQAVTATVAVADSKGVALPGPRFAIQPVAVGFPKAPERPDDVAVIIGNADYRKQARDIPDVRPAYADAEGMRLYATTALGIRDTNVIVLKDATVAQMTRVFGTEKEPRGQLHDWVKPGRSRVFVYYSGHGAPGAQGGSPYLVPADADAGRIEVNGYALKTLYDNLGQLPAESVTVVLEACFSGLSPAGSLIGNASPVFIEVKAPRVPARLTVITAGAANQMASWEQDGSAGLFTKHFLMGMAGAADTDTDGRVTLDELDRYLASTVTYLARRHYGRDQAPQIVKGGGQ